MSDNFEFLAPLYGLDKNGGYKYWEVSTCGALIKVTHGKLGGKLTSKLTECVGKNIGKSNETTPSEQAKLEAAAKWVKQVKKCYRESTEEAKLVGEKLPMLAENAAKKPHLIKFPCDISPKCDGVRCIATVNGEDVELMSRGGDPYKCPDHLREQLVELSKRSKIKKFDGELMIFGMALQNIVSAVKKPNANTKDLQYFIFDLPISNMKWSERRAILDSIGNLDSYGLTDLKFIQNHEVASMEAAQKSVGEFMQQGYEGTIIRNLNGMYEYNHRSNNLLKMKTMIDHEFKVVGFKTKSDGNGEAVLSCEGYYEGNLLKFDAKPKGSHAQRTYKALQDWLGKWVTVSFQAMTADNTSVQFPVIQYLRECNENGEPLV